jgi:hypothetical protein
MHPPTHDLLSRGTPRQRAAHAVLRDLDIFARLADYHPVLAGTLPLPIHTDASDLDILCEVHDSADFLRAAAAYAAMPAYAAESLAVRGVPTTLVRWRAGDFDIELFGQPIPVDRQHGLRHLRLEARILALAGPAAVAAITAMKRAGVKTEPAFARYLGLAGPDPYLALLALEDLDDPALRRLLPPAPQDS